MEFVAGLVFAWITVLCMTNGAPTADSEDASTNILNGNYILGIGESTNNIVLRLLGKSLINRESAMSKFREDVEQLENKLEMKMCQMHPCGEWSAWTACSVKNKGDFGIKNRTRECGRNTSICTFKAEQEVAQTESELCEGSFVCPEDYTFTSGYCFKLFKTSKVTALQAQNECQNEKGHVMNVNTKVKHEVLSAFLTSQNVKSSTWINGRRDEVGGKWEYTYGEEPEFVNWHAGQPNEKSKSNMCRSLHTTMTVYDIGCTSSLYFVCEIP